MLEAVSTGFGFCTVSRCIGAGLVLTGDSGIGIALGSGTFSIGSGFDNPFDSVATTFSFGASVEGSGMAALLTSVALIALSPDCFTASITVAKAPKGTFSSERK